MKRWKLTAIITGFFILATVSALNVNAQDGGELQKIRCTCYCHDGITASGQYTRDGVLAGKRDWLGKTAALYRHNANGKLGEFIGYYEFLDTGAGIDTDGDGVGDSIKRGKSIDVYKADMIEVNDWIAEYGDYVYIKIIDAEG